MAFSDARDSEVGTQCPRDNLPSGKYWYVHMNMLGTRLVGHVPTPYSVTPSPPISPVFSAGTGGDDVFYPTTPYFR